MPDKFRKKAQKISETWGGGIAMTNFMETALREVAAQTWEEAAKVCDEQQRKDGPGCYYDGASPGCCAKLIRAKAKEVRREK